MHPQNLCYSLTSAVGAGKISAKELNMWHCKGAGHAHLKIDSTERTKSIFVKTRLINKYQNTTFMVLPTSASE